MTLLSTPDAVRWMRLMRAPLVTERTLRRWVNTGRLTNHGNTRHILIDTNELDDTLHAT